MSPARDGRSAEGALARLPVARRVHAYLRTLRLLGGQTRDEVAAIRSELSERLTDQDRARADEIVEIRSQIAELNQHHATVLSAQHEHLIEILRFVHDHDASRRRRLNELRASESYETPFASPDPLVSVVIPTYDNYELLRSRALPSVLRQTYQNFEVLVVGDAAPDAARAAVESFADERFSFFNLPYRGPYPEDPLTQWQVAGVPPYNEAVRRARGLWIAPLDDDDEFRPSHLEQLLELAQTERHELAYGRISVHLPDGQTSTIGRFPPEQAQFGLQAAMYHRGLAEIFELELADAALGLPYDWGLCLRMLKAGVRIGMLDCEIIDYYPSRAWTPRFDEDPVWFVPAEPMPEHDPAELQLAPVEPASEWEYVPGGWERDRPTDRESGWDREDVALAYREKWPSFLAAIDGPGSLGVGHEVPTGTLVDRRDILNQNAVLVFAYALSRAAGTRLRLSVLDWGGATGHFYELARRLFPELELDYYCRELPAVCAVGRELQPAVTFFETDECFDRRYDIVIASNAIQYVKDWEQLLVKLAASSSGWTFLTKVPVTTRCTSFVVQQRADAYGYSTEYAGWVFNDKEFLTGARAIGLELEREFVLLDPLPISGAPDAPSHAGFLFRSERR